jgi:DNA modification methylase
VDFIFTSPPYPNDLEYTRQTRLELFLLGYVKNMEDVRDIKKKMVKGSTKLIFKESNSAQYVEKFESVQKVANAVEEALSDRKWGWDYPRMIREYFGDMYLSLESFKEVLRPGSYALLVVGDQTYKQIVIPVGKILVEIAGDLRYEAADLELLRIRRSTTHKIPLKEEIVILKK